VEAAEATSGSDNAAVPIRVFNTIDMFMKLLPVLCTNVGA
jgi:hypothetical protein